MKLKKRFDAIYDELSAINELMADPNMSEARYFELEAERYELLLEREEVGQELYESMKAAADFALGKEVGMRLVSELCPDHEVGIWWFDPNEPCDRHTFNYYNGSECFEAYDPEWGFEIWVKPVEYLTR